MRSWTLTLLSATCLSFALVSASAMADPPLEIRGADLALLLPAAPGSLYPDLSNAGAFTEDLFFLSREGYLILWAHHKLGREMSRAEANAIVQGMPDRRTFTD